MNLPERIENAYFQAIGRRRCTGAVKVTVFDGEITAVSTADETLVTVNGEPMDEWIKGRLSCNS